MGNALKASTQIKGGNGGRARRLIAAGVMAVSFAAGTGAASAGIVESTPDLFGPTVVAGGAFYSDGTSARSGPPGARVSVFATSAEPGFAYKLVSGRPNGSRPCGIDIMAINETVRYANAEGVISQTAGPLNRPAGEWQICFLAQNQTVTGAATYTVSG